MKMAVINVEEHSRHIGLVYQKYYARLHYYFQAQLGDTPEAEDCVQETIRRFFFFMEDRVWEADAENVPVYLMRIAGALLCAKRAAAGQVGGGKAAGRFGRIRNELIQPFRARLESVRLLLKALGVGQPGTRPAHALRRAPAATV
jgi:hypothetical protein